MSEAAKGFVIAIMVVVEFFQTLIRKEEKPRLYKRLPK